MPNPAPLPRRRILASTLLFIAVIGMSGVLALTSGRQAASAAEGNVRLSPPMSTVEAEDGTFTVYVVIDNLLHIGGVQYDDNRDGVPDRSVPSDGLGAFQFTIEYDPDIVAFEDATKGPNLSGTGRSFQCLPVKQDPGAVTFGCLSPGPNPAGPQGDLTLASVQFAPRGSGLSPLVLSAEVAGPLGDSTEVDVGGGAVRVNGNVQIEPTERAGNAATATALAQTPPFETTPGATLAPPAATASAVASETASAETQTAVASTPSATPMGTPPKDDDSSSRWWLWLLGGGIGVTVAAGGFVALLARRSGTL